MAEAFDLETLKAKAKEPKRYQLQLARLHSKGYATGCIEQAVKGAVENLVKARSASLVIYGEPQSGKTEMMICLTAKLLDQGHRMVVHLLNDNLDLLSQNLKRFKGSQLAPAPKTSTELVASDIDLSKQDVVAFCTKNARHLSKLITRLDGIPGIVVIDDEADYATPNSKINKGQKTRINELIEKLIGSDGYYIGVTATPARLDLNRTLHNDTEHWVQFPPHEKYTGQEIFFPVRGPLKFKLVFLTHGDEESQAREALLRYLVRSAYLNSYANEPEKNYSYLVHTSGKKNDHETDRVAIESTIAILTNPEHKDFAEIMERVFELARELYPDKDANRVAQYVATTAPRTSTVVLNSLRDRKAAGDNPTEPTSPFTIYIGGNIVSRGVTFPNLLGMYFTRNVVNRLQQDTYIQRARMFGDRGEFLEHFELTIPPALYADWQRCFTYHKLALSTIKEDLGSPIWIGDGKVAVTGGASINNTTVTFNRGEMAFQMFDMTTAVLESMLQPAVGLQALKALRQMIGNRSLPEFLIKLIEATSPKGERSVVLHRPSDISNQAASAGTDHANISRPKGFMGKSQIQQDKFPDAMHHVKVFYNSAGKGRVFYKLAGLELLQNA